MTQNSNPNPYTQYWVDTSYASGSDQIWLLPPNGTNYAIIWPLQIPYLYTGKGDPSTLQVTNVDFTVQAIGSGTPTQANVNMSLQLTGTNAWSTDPTARATFRTNFVNLIEALEQFELSSPQLLVSGAAAIIRAVFVQYMPLPLTEVLLYACGLESGIGTGAAPSIDVLPGMRLRCEPAVRQYTPDQAFSGYVTIGTSGWEVATSTASGGAVRAFDAFMGAIAAPQITPPAASPPLYGLLDLQLVNTGYKYHRLMYPQNVISGSAIGNLTAQENVQLIGANTLTDLRKNPPYSRIFFGRTVVIPEICIWFGLSTSSPGVQPQPIYVPVGTTVNNLLERFTSWKPLSTSNLAKLVNLYRPQISNLGSSGGVNASTVNFVPKNLPNPYSDLRALDLPLLPGDILTLTIPMLSSTSWPTPPSASPSLRNNGE